MKYYAGIGSRETPLDIRIQMTALASELEQMGYCLRSGNADGADQAFAEGVNKNAVIWIPSESFNSEFIYNHPTHTYKVLDESDSEAFDSVATFHPNIRALSPFAKKLMARNYRQINDDGLSDFVICWTKDGKFIGGTGQALRIAEHFNIPIYNMYKLNMVEILQRIMMHG